ncbi:HAMP domain-containing sensor histidine kinase [Taibaiella koreensis]|uniref:HAMP domain-containing sensor histidine kinase n=1 Tax=Taibaiella koreensis TaxID=1268548 RepID=UPI000E599F3C|nr:ATP-binding protein [Taibaiella koreensis]
MQIRTRLTLLFTLLVAALLLAFASTVYFTSSETREDEYFKRLKQQASTKANLLFDTKIDPNVLQLIYKNAPNALFQEEVAIYDTVFHLLYHDAVEIDKVKETRGMIDKIIAQKEMQFYINDLQVVGFLYEHQGKHYVITAAARDEYGLTKLATLRNTIVVALLISLVIIFFAGRFLAKKTLQPVSSLVSNVKEITATNLDLRVDEGNRKDEIAALAITFNEMLNRLEHSFDAQKDFVSNISHELRTPLTAMLAELQLTTEKERSNEEYKQAIAHAISDTQKLIRLSNSLLDLAKANYDQTEIAFKPIRLDELLLDARADVLHNQFLYKVKITFEREIEEDSDITVRGNEYLLKVAFINLMENGCKFSEDHESTVSITYDPQNILLRFSDRGIGISPDELPHIFTPFYRGANKNFTGGNGIGLSLTKKIIALHGGLVAVSSREKEGTIFTLTLPHR